MEGATMTGTLRDGLQVGDAVHKDFELRSATAADYFAAEDAADSSKTIKFRAALAAHTLVRVGTFTGPFTLAMLGKLSPRDLDALLSARDALERQGEDKQPG